MRNFDDYIELNRTAYNKLANEYESRIENDREKDTKLLSSFCDYLDKEFVRDIKVIDAGCGNGLNLSMFSERNYFSVGVELAEAMCVVAQKTSPKSLIVNNNFLDIHFTGNTFNGILAKAFIHLFPADEAIRVLKVFNHIIVPNGIVFIATNTDKHPCEGLHIKDDYKSHQMRFRKYWGDDEIRNVVTRRDIGFEIMEDFYTTEQFNGKTKKWLNLILIKK